MEASNAFSYMSEPSSPITFNIQNMYFYSVPTSPRAPSELNSPGKNCYEDANSTFDDFEFGMSCRFNPDSFDLETSQKLENIYTDETQPMAFADELFYDGKVLPLLLPPLKLPPRLNHESESNASQNSTLSSPHSPSSVLKVKFSQPSLWNDGFDPFMVALENVRGGKSGGKTQKSFHNHRRVRSLSPLRAVNSCRPNNEKGLDCHQNGDTVDQKLGDPLNCSPKKDVVKSSKGFSEPRGLAIARVVRLGKMEGQGTVESDIMGPFSRPIVKRRENGEESGGPYKRVRKRDKIKKFLSRSASMKTPTFLRRLSFKPIGEAQCSEEKKVTGLTRMTLVHYRPKMLLCLGYGSKYAK